MMYLALASGLTLTVWATFVVCYAVWVQKTETQEYKLIRDYMRTIREQEYD